LASDVYQAITLGAARTCAKPIIIYDEPGLDEAQTNLVEVETDNLETG